MLRPLFLSFLYLCHRISIPRIPRINTDYLPSEFCGLFISARIPRISRIMQIFVQFVRFVFREYKSVSICAKSVGEKIIPFVGK